MKFIIKYFYWIILAWITFVLTFFKIYNDFYFQNNQSIIFIFLLISVPITLIVVRHIIHKRNIKKIKNIKTDYDLKIENDLDKVLVDFLKKQTTVKIIDKKIYFGNDYQGIITYNQTFLEVKISNTEVCIRFYYAKTINQIKTFDKLGYEFLDAKVLLEDVKGLINDLLKKEVIYKAVTRGKKDISSKLYIDNTLRFTSHKKSVYKDQKYNKIIKIEL